MRILFPFLFLFLTLISCKKDIAENDGETAYIGGEIINPIDNKIIIHKSNKIIDTILLDKNNRFLYKIKHLEDGLYTFKLQAKNGSEFQLALLEPNDSIMIRLNTIDFDESLVYTGRGAKKNNYLINMFLENETENEKILNFCQLKPEVFENKIDSIKRKRTTHLNQFLAKSNYSELFKEIAYANINYNYYISKEIYPFAYYGNNEIKNLQNLPKDFYNYRKDINYNNTTLKDYFTYNTFLRYHFRNLALSEHLKYTKDSIFNRASYTYNLEKLKLIDSLVINEEIKNPLLRMSTSNYINKTRNLKELDDLLSHYYSKSTNENDKKYIESLVSSLKLLKAGNKIPNVSLVNYKNKEFKLHKLIKKPTVLYFWSKEFKLHVKESHAKVTDLKNKYPEISFISINTDSPDTKSNFKFLKQINCSTEYEYQFKNPKEAKQTLAINPIIKVILLDRKGKIMDPHTSLFSVNFEEKLLGLINQ